MQNQQASQTKGNMHLFLKSLKAKNRNKFLSLNHKVIYCGLLDKCSICDMCAEVYNSLSAALLEQIKI